MGSFGMNEYLQESVGGSNVMGCIKHQKNRSDSSPSLPCMGLDAPEGSASGSVNTDSPESRVLPDTLPSIAER